ncbi:ABC transporter permease [Syntrophorhabdus aromaticivorans]|jgi:NitT/TauT family transport system permease protein|uniref:ABC transporter permease n=1 Tax=Syntrophorhabdus aromaticivorans TaxID=328301 RepID=A0A351U1J9_9BACT|nr:ABC transporter permease [Syntrophorhabdus aromaticivorans]NLW35909.1 ABC transporter permease [Syntrophorhabdus aromaticivorans]HBA53830.1 ABC transporter permease [Syntrophorhabdus aromaticivorans]
MKRHLVAAYGVTILLIYAVWYVVSLLLGTNILPDPFLVLRQGLGQIHDSAFWGHVEASTVRILAGLLFGFILAVPLGLCIGSNENLDRLFAPLIYLGYPVPKIVLMPIVFVLFGLGEAGKIVLITLIVFFQLLITTRDSAKKISAEVIYSLKSLGGNRRHFYRHVVWPISLPGIFTSLRIGTGTAVAVLFFVESIATRKGLGFYIIDAWGRADYPTMFVGIIALSVIGIILYEAFDILERRFCRWKNA